MKEEVVTKIERKRFGYVEKINKRRLYIDQTEPVLEMGQK
jgi:hypothetical protein